MPGIFPRKIVPFSVRPGGMTGSVRMTRWPDPYILDHYYVWFKNNCPLSGPLYDDMRFEPLHGDRNGRYFVVIRDSPHETHKWTIYTERHGFEQPEFTCANVRDMLRHINTMAPETWRGDPQPAKAPHSPQKKRKEAER